jgi:hypothetical protein
MELCVKSRTNGADIDGKKIRVQARHMDAGGGDNFDFFNTTLGEGVAVAALSTTNDVQNDTAVATVSAYSDVLNSGGTANAPLGGYQLIDLNNGNGPEPYYSQWTFGAQGDGLKALWEYSKELSYQASTKTIDSLAGYLFLGVSHEFDYDGLSGTFTEQETVVWGTKIFYDGLVSGPFTAGNYVTIGTLGAAGRVMYDDGVDELIVALEDTSITIFGDDAITEYPGPSAGATTTTAVVNTGIIVAQDETSYDDTPTSEGVFVGGDGAGGTAHVVSDVLTLSNGATLTVDAIDGNDDVTQFTINTNGSTVADGETLTQASSTGTGTAFTLTPGVDNLAGGETLDNDKSGGSGLLLADDTTDTLWIQLLTGSAPVNDLPLRGITSAATALVNGSATARTVSKQFTGSYTGSYIGAFGVGFDPNDLTANELLTDLLNVNQTPPNNVTYSVTGVVVGEDRVLVGPRTGVLLDTAQDTINGTLTSATTGSIVMTTAIPSDTPATGTIRVQNDVGRFILCNYTVIAGSTYTISPTVDFSSENATTGNDQFISYIDKLATSTTESFTSIYSSPRNLFVRVRDGGGTPIKQFESTTATLSSTGGSVGVIRTTDA